MRYAVQLLIGLLFSVPLLAQRTVTPLNATIRELPFCKLTEYAAGEYLVFNGVEYYEDTPVGGLIKVDGSGKRITGFKSVFVNGAVNDVVVLPSGKILICGSFTHVNNEFLGCLVRLHADGSVDKTFAPDNEIFIRQFAVQSTGKIVIGYSHEPTIGICEKISRLNADGSTDLSFSELSDLAPFEAINISPEDDIYLSSLYSFVHHGSQFIRLTPGGEIDDSFNPGGVVPNGRTHIIFLEDKMLLSAEHLDASSFYNYLVRLNMDGSVDNSFTSVNVDNGLNSVVLRKNGKILITGFLQSFDGITGNAFELNEDGTFYKTILVLEGNAINSIYEDHSENIFITGRFTKVNGLTRKGILKISPDYKITPVKFPISRKWNDWRVVTFAVEADGSLLIGKGHSSILSVNADTLKLSRLNDEGEIVPFTGPLGINSKGFVSTVNSIVTQGDKILLSGYDIFNSNVSTFCRLLPNGKRDSEFLISGLLDSEGKETGAEHIKVKNSKIYLTGFFETIKGVVSPRFAVLDAAGNPLTLTNNQVPINSHISDIEVQDNGKVLLLGEFPTLSEPLDRGIIRINTDGSLDTGFRVELEGISHTNMVIDGDGRILVGEAYGASGAKILRFNENGSPDNTLDVGDGFEGDGIFPNLYAIKILNDGTIAVAGYFVYYKGVEAHGFVLLNSTGERIPIDYSLEAGSMAFNLAYSPEVDQLYVLGDFIKDHGVVRTNILSVHPKEEEPLSVQEEFSSSDVYPNPAERWIRIKLPENIQHAHVKIHSLNGTVHLSNNFTRESLDHVDVGQLAPGLYVITVATPERTQRIKLIKK